MSKSLSPFTDGRTRTASKANGNALVLQVEQTRVASFKVPLRSGEVDGVPVHVQSWDPRPSLTDPSGVRLIEEIVRRTRLSGQPSVDYIAISMPGTIDGTSTIEASSRLNISHAVDVASLCKKLGAPPTYVFHDVESLAKGEARSGALPSHITQSGRETFAYILIDEGVGASLFIDGRAYRGAGVAGHIGRLVLEPSGAFNPAFESRGTLEVFAARPWVSQNVVNEYLAEKGKTGAIATASQFRDLVDAAYRKDKRDSLTFQQLADGAHARDPIVLGVLHDAAHYLSVAINAVITIMNPPLIMLGGGMITEIPEFPTMVISYARRNAWAGSWNETTIHIASAGRIAQVSGAAHLLCEALGS